MVAGEGSVSRGLDDVRSSLITAAAQFGTPVYVLDVASIAAAATMIEDAFPRPWIWQYSLKANDLPAVAGYLHSRGWGANVVSLGEWRHAMAAGVAQGSVTLEGIGKTDDDLEYAVQQSAAGFPLRWLAIESPEEAHQLRELARKHEIGQHGRPPLDVLVRLNPGVDPETRAEFAVGSATSKFGMDADEILALVHDGLRSDGSRPDGLRLRGVHVHVGSDLRNVAGWAEAGVTAVKLASELRSYVDTIDTVDVGGGFPVPTEGAPRPIQFVKAFQDRLESYRLSPPPRLAIEPGRFLVGQSGWLVSRVLHSRPRRHLPQQTVLDAGMTELIRPALYGSLHDIHALRPAHHLDSPPPDDHRSDSLDTSQDLVATSVEGPICELTDSFGIHPLPHLHRGDLVAIEQAGAYAGSFTSRYNGRPQPPEVLLWPDGLLQLCPRPLSGPRAAAQLATIGEASS